MKRSIITTAIAAGAALVAGSAMAQSYGSTSSMSQDTAVNSPSAMYGSSSQSTTTVTPGAFSGSFNAPSVAPSMMPSATSATSAGVNVSATAPQVILLDSSTPGATLVSSPPVPDTVENRARYGGPESHGGRATRPAGN